MATKKTRKSKQKKKIEPRFVICPKCNHKQSTRKPKSSFTYCSECNYPIVGQ